MRIIKFRAWDNVHKQFDSTVAANLLMQMHEESEDLDEEYGIRFFLSEFTGFQDRNGNDIYEDDIIAVWNEGNIKTDIVRLICFNEYYHNFSAATPYGDMAQVTQGNTWQMEVIGNTYENEGLFTPTPPFFV